jgi:hypothetical protein
MKRICISLLLLFCFSFSVEAKDKDKSKPREIDTTPPVGSVQIIPQINGEYLNFTVSFVDPAPGIGMGAYCINNYESCSNWLPYTGPVTIHWLMLSGSGLRTIYIYGKDLLGRIGLSKIMVIKQ